MDAPPSPPSQNHGDDRLGMNEPISRRDFLNGAFLAGAGLLLHGKAPTISPLKPSTVTDASATTATQTATPGTC